MSTELGAVALATFLLTQRLKVKPYASRFIIYGHEEFANFLKQFVKVKEFSGKRKWFVVEGRIVELARRVVNSREFSLLRRHRRVVAKTIVHINRFRDIGFLYELFSVKTIRKLAKKVLSKHKWSRVWLKEKPKRFAKFLVARAVLLFKRDFGVVPLGIGEAINYYVRNFSLTRKQLLLLNKQTKSYGL